MVLIITTFCIERHYAKRHFAGCRILFIVVLNVIMRSIVMLSTVMLNVIMHSVVALSVIILSTFMLIVPLPSDNTAMSDTSLFFNLFNFCDKKQLIENLLSLETIELL
jgi:hypothetical protein